jgi:hypothetical protein
LCALIHPKLIYFVSKLKLKLTQCESKDGKWSKETEKGVRKNRVRREEKHLDEKKR